MVVACVIRLEDWGVEGAVDVAMVKARNCKSVRGN